MLILGAKGFAKELLEVVLETTSPDEIFFYDDVNKNVDDLLFNKFKIINNIESATNHLSKKGSEFAVGMGNPLIRELMSQKFIELGGRPKKIISNKAIIGSFDSIIQDGSIIMQSSIITNSVKIGRGCLININCTIGHDCVIDDYVELCPGVNISGSCSIGRLTFVGTNATILPKITIGKNVVIAAGAVVTKNVPDNSMVAGVPGIIKKTIK